MAPTSTPNRRTPTGRPRGRPPGKNSAARRAARQAGLGGSIASEPPPKKRKYIPGGPGGGGRFVDPGDPEYDSIPTISRTRGPRVLNGASPIARRERSTRTRATGLEDVQFSSAAAIAATMQQADDYKPREERSWEEFHPNLDIDKTFMIFHADDVDGLPQPEVPGTPVAQTPGTPFNGSTTPSRQINPASTGTTPNPQRRGETNPFDSLPNATPSRRSRRPTRDVISFYGTRSFDLGNASNSTLKTPKILPLKNQTAKEKLDLKLPSYRKTNRIELFESKTFGQARYVDKAMSNVGYQESDEYLRPGRRLVHATDIHEDDELEASHAKTGEEGSSHSRLGRVEYDMDEQDDMWLEHMNTQRKQSDMEVITREIFEITMTKIEKEWHALEKRIPKPNPKPPQTHRPRSGSAAAVNGEPQAGEEPDSKCAICDDGDCENTNAIVFCDGCNLAVHQECYGVPFIPEGQWLCRKCQLCGRGVPTCIFCPNTDGAFKQTNSSKWAHLLCAMWIPEITLGNHTFMEPVMDVEKVPKTRWKLNCYICNQKMGACIQCGNKNCYQAFHVTCARRARLYLKMKTPTGALAVLDGSMVLKAFCDKHCPDDYAEENKVHAATKAARKFYRRNMQGRIWADNHAIANVIAAQQRNAILENNPPEENSDAKAADKKKPQQQKNVWRLPSGAPVIPQAVFEVVELALQRFTIRKRKEFIGEACRYWTLKREARRGAALLKRLQLQMESFSSMELTRRDFAAMGPDGKGRLARRINFAQELIGELEQLKSLADHVVQREQIKLEATELEAEFVDECYFPVSRTLAPAIEKAISLDRDLFGADLALLQTRVEERYYVTALSFAQDLGDIIRKGIMTPPKPPQAQEDSNSLAANDSTGKSNHADIRDRRKLGKRILKAIQPQLEAGLRIESEISGKPLGSLQKELEAKVDASLDIQNIAETTDSTMDDAPIPIDMGAKGSEIDGQVLNGTTEAEEDPADEGVTEPNGVNGNGVKDVEMTDAEDTKPHPDDHDDSQTPPNSNAYMAMPQRPLANPPTPPQSNGSLGKDPTDPLTDGGVLWYLKTFKPEGTSVVPENWAAGRDAIRSLSEDLTDLDDEELKGLGRDVNEAAVVAANGDEGEDETTTTTTVDVVEKGKVTKAVIRNRRTSQRRR